VYLRTAGRFLFSCSEEEKNTFLKKIETSHWFLETVVQLSS
jgi:hypothetical protein